MAQPGKIFLVGAGPGDPGLLTIKARQILEQADVVIYDRLVSREIMRYAPQGAELIYAGKAAGGPALAQESINALLVAKALAGKLVVRLKGGDPFIFGRGAEEALYIQEQGCDFEVVPGVPSATSVPACAGIPLTHRDLASSFAVITGHEQPGKDHSSINWQSLARGVDTLVVLMGVATLVEILEQLIANGKPPETPAALVGCGTLPGQRVISATVGTLAAQARAAGLAPPAILVVGPVVSLQPRLNWAARLPLWGKRVLVTRAREQAAFFTNRLERLGAQAIGLPLIRIVREPDLSPLHHAFGALASYDWIIFTSINAVEIFFDELLGRGKDARSLSGMSVGAIGPATARQLRQHGLQPDLVPTSYCAEGLIEALHGRLRPGQRVLLPRAHQARALLPEALRRSGAAVDEVCLYSAGLPSDLDQDLVAQIRAQSPDYITFTSPSAVRNFVHIIGRERLPQAVASSCIACIGPITAAEARQHGLRVDLQARSYTIEGLIEVLVNNGQHPPQE